MHPVSRRRFLKDTTALSVGLALSRSQSLAEQSTAGWFSNPVLAGDYPDASPIRVIEDFYLTHSSFDYAPGLLIWHSRDLVNWRPVAAALHKYYGDVWAPYLCEFGSRFYIYFPVNAAIFVVHANHPEGPWSEPISLGINGIDPGHIAENGRRFLYFAGGGMAELTSDGLAIKTALRQVVEPWPIPSATRIECTCMEAPKLLQHGGYFYLNVAEGGTAGPATSHSVISARSRHAGGPWEYSPYNPIVHTPSRDARWLSLGHGRLVDTVDGKWYMTVHAYENGYRTLGRQMLLLPVEWTDDGWFRIPKSGNPESSLPIPISTAIQLPFTDPSDDFKGKDLGLQWAFWHDLDTSRFKTGQGQLTLRAKGSSVAESSVLGCIVGGHSYTVEVDVEIEMGCEGGLLLYYNPEHFVGILFNGDVLTLRLGNGTNSTHPMTAKRMMLRIVNDRQEIDYYFQIPGRGWKRSQESTEISSMNHNVLGGFLDVRPALSSCGSGNAIFRNFRYWGTANQPG